MADASEPTVVATAANAAEAQLIIGRLAAAGIAASERHTIGNVEFGDGGSRFVYAEAEQADRAREVLAESTGISDEELARQAREAAE
jgi:hypothetical protein